jgi:hypothetical protein
MSINRIIYEEDCCAYNAYVNQRNAYKALNLKWVFGSCAYSGFWEYGGPDYDSYDDFKRGDYHAWLEDKEGRVYDFITNHHDFCARINTGKALKVRGLVEGVTKEEMKRLGVTYLPASEKVRVEAFLHLLPMMKKCEMIVKAGHGYKSKWEGKIDDLIYASIPTDLGRVFKEQGYFFNSPKGKAPPAKA